MVLEIKVDGERVSRKIERWRRIKEESEDHEHWRNGNRYGEREY